MVLCSQCHEYKSEEFTSYGVCETCAPVKPEILTKLQSRILELETELRWHKASSETNARILQMMWGFRFNTDSLH